MGAYGVPSQIVDGMDVLAVHRAAGSALAQARNGQGPVLLECKTYRFIGHSRSDARGYRSKDEEADWKRRDPIPRLRDALIAEGRVEDGNVNRIEAEVAAEIDDAVEFARSSPETTAEMALEGVYA
jgi:TPP-dependent pyruvate/acetoin dehydrogenase alpha subunit